MVDGYAATCALTFVSVRPCDKLVILPAAQPFTNGVTMLTHYVPEESNHTVEEVIK